MSPIDFKSLFKEAQQHDDFWVQQTIISFTEQLFQLLQNRQLSKSEFAQRLKTSPAYITKIMRGNVNFTIASMVRIARTFGMTIDVNLKPCQIENKWMHKDNITPHSYEQFTIGDDSNFLKCDITKVPIDDSSSIAA